MTPGIFQGDVEIGSWTEKSIEGSSKNDRNLKLLTCLRHIY